MERQTRAAPSVVATPRRERRLRPDIRGVRWHTDRRADGAGNARGPELRACQEIEAAILLVSGGRIKRVIVSNLADCPWAIRELGPFAEAAGVRLEPLRDGDGRSRDVAVTAA